MLALLLLFHHAAAKESSKGSHVIQKIDTCPDIGYYFKRDLTPNAIEPVCYLCFCQDNNTAVCWARKNSRCDVNYHNHLGRKRRYTRNRRSPGFSDIFLRDAARDVFDRNTPEQCKPFQSSISDGCPPADWCIGCTVCDCDANGRWDCHILSFCPYDKGKKKMRKRRGFLRNNVMKGQLSKKPKVNTTKKPIKQLTKKPSQKQQLKQTKKQPVKGKKPQLKHNIIKTNKLQIKQYKGKQKKGSPLKKQKTQIHNIRIPQKNEAKSNSKIIQKLKKSNFNNKKEKSRTLNANESALRNVAQTILKKVMASVEKIVSENHSKLNTHTQGKPLQKRSMPANKNGLKNSNKPIKFKNMNKWPKKVMKNDKMRDPKNKSRNKREISRIINASFYTQKDVITNTANSITKELRKHKNSSISQNLNNDSISATLIPRLATNFDYFKYIVDFDEDKLGSNKNKFSTKKGYFSIPNQSLHAPIEIILNAKSLPKNQSIINHDVIKYNITKVNEELKKINDIPIIIKLNNSLIWNNSKGWETSETGLNRALQNNVTCGKICKLKRIFIKAMGFSKINVRKRKSNGTKFNILNYWKKIYRQVFQKNKAKRKPIKHNSFCKRNVITTICKHIKYCKLQPMSEMLSSKLDLLRAESDKILKSIQSIKGLLKLLNKDSKNLNCITNFSTSMNEHFSDIDFKMLNAIIKENYDEYNLYNLTKTESTQVAYIKQNTEIFVESVEKFADILHDIIKVLTFRNINDLHRNLRSPYIQKSNTIKVIRNETVEKQLNKIKKLFVNYNLLQNKFLKQIHDVMMTLAPKTNVRIQKERDIKVSSTYLQKNDTDAVRNYTKNIITNLRKLKILTQKLSFNNRRKRAAIGDDEAIEYLLILMEYLLKQNKPLNVSPVNDGIDLLIEAIKSAPDIKPIKKKVLDYAMVKKEIGTTEIILTLLKNNITNDKNIISSSKINKYKTFESIDEDEEDSDLYQYDKKLMRNSKLKTEDNYGLEDLKKDFIYSNTHSTKSEYYTTENEKNGEETSDAVLAKLDTESNDNKRYQVFIDDPDDDDDDEVSSSTTPKSTEREVTYANVIYAPERTTIPASVKDHSKNKKFSLNWIEENREEEQRESSRFVETTTQDLVPTTQSVIQVVTRTIKKPVGKLDKYNDPISSISRESVEEDRKKTKNDKSEYVAYKKQMDVLNSLDYGTEKSALEADSKEDKYNVESFPLYFV